MSEKRYKIDGVVQCNRQKDAFRLTFGELVSEMWKRRITRCGVESTDRLRLQKVFDEDYRMVERKRMRDMQKNEKPETNPADSPAASGRSNVGKLNFASAPSPTMMRSRRPSAAQVTQSLPVCTPNSKRERSQTLDAMILSDAEVVAHLLKRSVPSTGQLERDREILQCCFDEESERRASICITTATTSPSNSPTEPTARRLSTTKPWTSGGKNSSSVLEDAKPERQLVFLSDEEVLHALQVRRLSTEGDAPARRRELLGVLEKEYACALEGWMDARLLTTSSVHNQMNRRGLQITSNRSLDILNLQGVLNMEFCERFYRYKAIIENYLLPMDVYEQPKEMLYVEMTKRGLPSADNWDRDAKLLQRALDEEYLAFLKVRMKHGLPVTVKLIQPRRRSSALGSMRRPSDARASSIGLRRPSSKRSSLAVVNLNAQAVMVLARVAEGQEDGCRQT